MSMVALVTGASRNIGRAIALALARDGWAIACFGRDRAGLDETARLVEQTGSSASVHVGDAAVDVAVEAFVADAAQRHGGIDALVNNAGIMHEAPVADVTPQDFRHVLDVNLVAGYTAARAAHPHLRARGGGVVVNVGSMFGAMGVRNAISYCASKAGVEGLTRALAAEFARDNVRVVGIAPGYVKSDISRDALADPVIGKRIVGRIPLRRVGEPEEIGTMAAFLASPKAAFITGEMFVVDGGQRMAV